MSTTHSPQRRAALSLVAAFNAMNIPAILSHRTSTCTRHFLPSTISGKPQDNATYERHLKSLLSIFRQFELTVDDVIEEAIIGPPVDGALRPREDMEGISGRVVLWLTARGDSVVGEYRNEYVWLLEFEGGKISKTKEYSDSLQAKEFWPKLQAAMSAEGEKPAKVG